MRKTQIIGIGNQKGGVAKTTTTVNLAAALGEMGRRVLIVDLDSSTGATSCLGVPDAYLGSCEVMLGLERPEDVIISNDSESDLDLPRNVDLICGRRNLEHIDGEFQRQSKFADGSYALNGPLEGLEGRYDYILLDTAPNTNTPTTAAYKASQWFLLSAMPSALAIEGLNDAMADIAAVREYGNPNLKLLGVVLSLVDGRKTRLGSQLIDYVSSSFPKEAGPFYTQISRTVAIRQAEAEGHTIIQANPKHPVAEQYRSLAREVEARITQRQGQDDG